MEYTLAQLRDGAGFAPDARFVEAKPVHRVVTVTVVDLTDLDELLGRLEDMRDSGHSLIWTWTEEDDA